MNFNLINNPHNGLIYYGFKDDHFIKIKALKRKNKKYSKKLFRRISAFKLKWVFGIEPIILNDDWIKSFGHLNVNEIQIPKIIKE